ncbi:MAG: ABC transporter permease, partial [Phycisphaerae bacterium]|nr:ABC transporter permease [Gemmatimonadaceae bacterium]
LPFPNPEQLVQVWSSTTNGDRSHVSVSVLDVDDWRAQKKRFTDIGGYFYAEGQSGSDLTGRGEPQRVSVATVTPGFFSTLGVAPAIGRLPAENEMVRGGDDKVVMLSHAYWKRAFGSDATIVGQSLVLGGEAYRVLGVMPPQFTYPSPTVEMYLPHSTIPDHAIPRIRPVRLLNVVARMAPGVTPDQARAEMNSITRDLAKRYPNDNASYANAELQSLAEVIAGPVKTPLMVLLAAVLFVLLMACVNIASLLLARATARTREVAVRVSLGATRSRIVRQLLTESLALATIGGILGLALAQVGTKLLVTMSGDRLPRAQEIHTDGVVLAFALGASLLAGLLFGVIPAIRASAVNLQDTMRAGSNSVVGGGQRLRSVLVVTQVAFAVVLAVGATLMTRSFGQLLQVNPGFTPDHLLAVSFTINTTRHGEDGAFVNFYQQVIERARAIPGVINAAAAQHAPFRGMGERNGFTLPGQIVPQGEEIPNVPTQRISDGWFKTIGTPIIAGREFTDKDRKDSPMVLVVNQAFVKKYFNGQMAVGKSLSFGTNANAEIVGVVGDIRQSAIEEEPAPLM